MKKIIFFLTFWEKHFFNLGISSLCLLFYQTQSFKVQLPLENYFLLLGGIMIVYNFDYLFDHYHSPYKRNKKNNFFYFFFILVFLTINLVLSGLLFYQKSPLLLKGMTMILALTSYFLLLRYYTYFYWFKEISVACIFSLTIMINFEIGNELRQNWLISWINLFLIILHNVLIFSYANKEKDQSNHQSSMVIAIGQKKMAKIIDGVGFLGILFVLFNRYQYHEPWLAFYLILIFLLQGILFKNYSQLNCLKLKPLRLLYLLGNSIFFLAFILFFPIYIDLTQ